jgi:hypothetical protein
VIETVGGVNQMIGVNEVDMQAEFSLLSASGKTLATASASGGAFADRNRRNAVRDVWDEKSEEIVGKLFQDYCGGR